MGFVWSAARVLMDEAGVMLMILYLCVVNMIYSALG
jgi:hypothetical protein